MPRRRGRRLLRDLHRGERGQVLALFALLLTSLLLIAALAIDIGYAWMVHAQAQAAADAAAAAGADVLPGGNAVSTATGMATTNGFTSGGSMTVTVNSPPTSGSHQGSATSVEVIISKRVNTFFAKVGGLNTITATARSVATAKGGSGAPCVICVMSPSASKAFTATGGSAATITGGNLVINSSAADAGYLTGSASINATAVKVNGGTSLSGTAAFHPTAQAGSTAIPDPLAGVPVPSVAGSNGAVCLSHSQTQTVNPGVYSSLEAVGASALTLNPGIYVITGTATKDPCTGSNGHGGMVVTNGASLTANGALIYFACPSYPTLCTPGQVGASFSLTGNGVYQVTAQTSGPYKGLSIFYDRSNAAPLLITNSGHNDFTGTMYAESAAMTVSGGVSTDQIDSIIVANTLTLAGSGTININYHASNNYAVGGSPGSSSLTE